MCFPPTPHPPPPTEMTVPAVNQMNPDHLDCGQAINGCKTGLFLNLHLRPKQR